METLIKADFFFFIASLATVVLSVLVSVLLYHLIKAGRNLAKLSEALKSDYNDSEEFVEELRERLEDNLIFRFFFPRSRAKRSAAKKDGEHKK